MKRKRKRRLIHGRRGPRVAPLGSVARRIMPSIYKQTSLSICKCGDVKEYAECCPYAVMPLIFQILLRTPEWSIWSTHEVPLPPT